MVSLLRNFPFVASSTTPPDTETGFHPWQVEEDNFPVDGTISQQLEFLINYAILAPSAHNTQPWLFKIADRAIELYADKTRALPIAAPDSRELIISCGAALFNLCIAIRYFGYRDLVELLPEPYNPNLLARIRLGSKTIAKAEEHLLFRAIPKRCTNRLQFANRQLPTSLISQLQLVACSQHTWLNVVPKAIQQQVIELIIEGDRLQMANPLFRQELAKWIRSGNSSSHDGIPAYAQGMDERLDALTPLMSFAVRSFDLGKSQSAKNQKLAEKALLLVLNSRYDTPRDWLITGEALEHLLLRARVDDVWASFFNQPIQNPQLRSRLTALFPQNGYPQIVLRLGYGKEIKPTPRRPIDEVLLTVNQ
ncbi:Acg family FMN-binding oxidoreductase [Myxosarcina sp. GI1(2024)]